MSDLDPLTNIPTVEDPGVIRLVVRGEEPHRVDRLVRTARTSCSIVVPDQLDDIARRIRILASWNPAGIRSELVVAQEPSSTPRLPLRKELAGTGVHLRFVDRPLGGRACVLAEAVDQATNEFMIVTTSADAPFRRVPVLLSQMWTEGSDVGLVSLDPDDGCEFDREFSLDVASNLTEWLGLSGVNVPGRLVMMRRWVARWLFNEIARSIDPAEELADRARLLGLTIVQLR